MRGSAGERLKTEEKEGHIMQKRSKRFGIVGIIAMAVCLLAAMLMAVGCAQEEKKEETSEPTLAPKDAEPEEEVVLPTEPFYVLIVGNDSRADTAEDDNGAPYSDTMMLARVDPVNYQVTTITIPRDTKTWMDGEPLKVNETYAYGGIEELCDQVESLTGVRPQYYFDMGFADFVRFVDALGGVSVEVPFDMGFKDVMTGDWIDLEAGMQDLDGAEALTLARVRKIFATDMDACRQTDDRAIVTAILQAVAGNEAIVDKAVSAMYDNAETNWKRADFEALVKVFAKKGDKLTVISGTGPYDGDIDDESGFWMAYRDEDAWHAIIEAVENGGSPDEVIAPPVQMLG